MCFCFLGFFFSCIMCVLVGESKLKEDAKHFDFSAGELQWVYQVLWYRTLWITMNAVRCLNYVSSCIIIHRLIPNMECIAP